MKRMLLAILILGIACPAAVPQTKDEKPQPPGATRVAVVNIGYVFSRYSRATEFKRGLEEWIVPYKTKAKRHQDNIAAWKKAINEDDLADETKEALNDKIRKATRELEDMAVELQKLLGKKQEEKLVELWNEVHAGVQAYSTKNRIELVFGYGEPLDKELLNLFPNINRKMKAMDVGGAVPLFIGTDKDIAEGVVELLHEKLRAKENGIKTPPSEPEPAKPQKSAATRMAVVNFAYVLENYEKAKAMKRAVEASASGPTKKEDLGTDLETLRVLIQTLQTELKADHLSADAKAELVKQLEKTIKRLRESDNASPGDSAKDTEARVVAVWKEMQDEIRTYAAKHSIQIVLGYADPADKAALARFPNINRNMQAMDSGGSVPLFAAPGVDIAEAVTDLLNKRLRGNNKQEP